MTGLWGALLNCLFHCVLNLLAYIHSVNMYPFVCLGIHFFVLFTDARIHVYLLIYFLIYSVGFCLSGQAPSLLWHVHHHTAFRCWQAAALSRPIPVQLRRRTIIHHCPPPLRPSTYCVAREAPDNWWTPPNNKQRMDDEMSYDNSNNTRVTVSNPEVKLWTIKLIDIQIGICKE